jgi:MOSC domain-containing protein YiiM
LSTIKASVAERFAEHVPYHRPLAEIERVAAEVGNSPTDTGIVEMIVCRPAMYEREVLEQGRLDVMHGLLGDNWEARTGSTPDSRADPLRQVTVMNSRALASIAGERDRWPHAGDQLLVDLDLSIDNLPAGTRLRIGEAVVEVTAPPHRGCAKFAGRFGADALAWANDTAGRQQRRRGLYVRVLMSGTVRPGDAIHKLP